MRDAIMALGVLALLTSCTTLGLVQYEGMWITKQEQAKIMEYQHRVFDLGIYDDDMSMSVRDPEANP